MNFRNRGELVSFIRSKETPNLRSLTNIIRSKKFQDETSHLLKWNVYSPKETIYLFLENLSDPPFCDCGNSRKFDSLKTGYFSTCRRKECTYWKNDLEVIKEQRKVKAQKTNIERYGDHPMRTQSTKEKLKTSMKEKYGFENITGYRVSQGTFKSAFSREDVKSKIKKIFKLKYGCHPMQTDETYENNLKSRVKFKNFTLPSGKIVRVQGYEDLALAQLLEKYDETDILMSVKDIHEAIGFIYYENGKKYYPDFYIKSTNTIIEVKSSWTYKSKLDQNLKKKQACEEKGLNFVFMIMKTK